MEKAITIKYDAAPNSVPTPAVITIDITDLAAELKKFIEYVGNAELTANYPTLAAVLAAFNAAQTATYTVTDAITGSTLVLTQAGVAVTADSPGVYTITDLPYVLTVSKVGFTTQVINVVPTRAEMIAGAKALTVTLVDVALPVITLTAETADVAAADVAAWDPAINVASATDNLDGDLSGSVVISYAQDTAEGEALADLAAARVHLGTLANVVCVMYNVADAANNDAVQKTYIVTAIA